MTLDYEQVNAAKPRLCDLTWPASLGVASPAPVAGGATCNLDHQENEEERGTQRPDAEMSLQSKTGEDRVKNGMTEAREGGRKGETEGGTEGEG